MNTSTELDALTNAAPSYLEGDPTETVESFPPLAVNYPRIDCTDLPKLDAAIRATLRIKTLSFKISYDSYVATMTVSAGGAVVKTTFASGPSGTQTVDYTVSTSPSGVIAYNGPLDEPHLLAAFLGHYGPTPEQGMTPLSGGVSFRPDDDTSASYCRTMIVRDATLATGLPYVFTLDLLSVFSPQNDGLVYVRSTGTAAPSSYTGEKVVPIEFLGWSLNGLTQANPQPSDSDSGQNPGPGSTTKNVTTYRATKLEVTASEFWSYDGKFDTESGALSN